MDKRGKHFRTETVATYTVLIVFAGFAIFVLKLFGGGITGFATFTSGPGEGQTTLMLQNPDTDNLDDAYVDGNLGDRNRGINVDLQAQRNPYQRIYIKFNITAIPQNQIIDDSQLCLYLYDDQGSQTVFASHVYAHGWNEGNFDNDNVVGQNYTQNITWNNQPCGVDFDNSANCNLTAESSITDDGTLDGTWQCWNVTNSVNEEYTSGYENVSIVLYTEDFGNADIFHSKEYTDDSSLIPYLNVTYHSANLPPSINLTSPTNTLYNDNSSIPLNFTVSDDNDGVSNLTCWYNLDSDSNTTIPSCANTTFGTSEGNHNLTIYVNDSQGLESSQSVSFDVDSTGVLISIIQPSGTKTSRTNIPVEYNTVGNNLTCWYNVETSIGGGIIDNTTLSNCSSSTFSVSSDGDYIINMFINNSLGSFDSDSSSFTVSTSSPAPSGGGGGGSSGGGGGSSSSFSVSKNLTINKISNVIGDPGETKSLNLNVKNTGTSFLNTCSFKSSGEYASWISGSGTKSLNIEEEYSFNFDLNVPEDAKTGSYNIEIGVNCKEINSSTAFNVEVIEKKLTLNLLDTVREDEGVRIIYSLYELSGVDQNVNLEFILFDGTEKVAETSETKFILANSENEFETFVNVDSSIEGNLNLLVNLNSESYSAFVQENIILTSSISGFSIFGERGDTNLITSYAIVIIFFIFAGIVLKRIFTFRKMIKGKK